MKVKKISRLFGVIWVIASLLWAGLGVAGIIYGSNWLSDTQTVLDDNLSLVVESLDSVHDIVNQTTVVVSTTHQSLGTMQVSVHDSSSAMSDLRPLLWETTKVVTLDIPNALDGVQKTMPSMIETAKSMDDTLTWLSEFEITIPNPFGKNWEYDMGISYNPDVPLDQALKDLSNNMEDIPDDLRDLDESLSTADANLLIISDDLAYLAGDMNTVNQQIEEIIPQLERFAKNVDDIQTRFDDTQTSIPDSFATAQKIMTAIFGLIIFTQIPSLYFGWLLVSGVLFPDN